MMELTTNQYLALKMLSYGVSMNLRKSFAKNTIQSLLRYGLIEEKQCGTRGGLPEFDCTITDKGKYVLENQ